MVDARASAGRCFWCTHLLNQLSHSHALLSAWSCTCIPMLLPPAACVTLLLLLLLL